MGIVDINNAVVGIIYEVTDDYAVVMNRIECLLQNYSDYSN